MVRIILKTFCIIFITTTSFCQSSKYFVKHYGLSFEAETGWGVLQTTNGNYIICGAQTKGDKQDAYLIITDSLGNVILDTTFGYPTTWESFMDIKSVGNNKYIAAGNHFGSGSYTSDDGFMVGFDANGSVFIEDTVGSDSLGNEINHFCLTDSGTIMTAGYNLNDTAETANILHLDSLGNIIWDKQSWWGTRWTLLNWIDETPDSNYIFAGTYGAIFSSVRDIWLLKTDINGNILLDMKYDFVTEETGTSVHNTNDGGFIISGILYSWNSNPDIYRPKGIILKVNNAGVIQWQKILKDANGLNDSIQSAANVVIPVSDNGYVAVGQISSFWPENQDILLIKLDSIGNEMWRRTFFILPDTNVMCKDEYGYDLKTTSDEGFVITGTTSMCTFNDPQDTIPDTLQTDVILLKTNCLGFTGPPVADFIYSIANDTLATFTNQSDSAGYFTWYFGDGDSLHATENDSFKSPVHSYADTGNYTVTLIAGACGEYDTLVYVIAVCTQPQAGFAYSTFNDSVQFTNTGGAANNYLWDFGDGSTGETANPAHVYAASGSYTVTLKAITCGDTAMFSDTLEIIITGIEQEYLQANNNTVFRVYPNPSSGTLTIEQAAPGKHPSSVYIYSMLGEVVYQNSKFRDYVMQVDLSLNSKGVYFVKVTNGEEIFLNKIILW